MERKIIKAAELRALFGGISNTTMHRYIADGTIPKPFKIGKVNGWYSDEIADVIDSLSSPQAA